MKNKFTYGGGVLATLILATLVSFASCSNGSTGDSGTDSNPVIDHSLGDAPAENLKLEPSYYSAKTDSDGIYITYKIPQGKNVQSCTVRIDGIGFVYENYSLLNESEGEFFYPFVTPNKKYTVRFAFSSKENEKDGWNYGGGEYVGWFDATVKAGEKSIGEVKLVDMGKVEVKANGDFRFTKKPAFKGESLLNDNGGWYMNVPLVEGISWLHENRKTKWRGELNIPSANLGKTINLYTYDENGSWRDDGDWEIGFICPRPRMEYETKDGRKFIYQWDGFIKEDLPFKPKNPANVNKLIGTWKMEYDEYEEDYYYGMGSKFNVRIKNSDILVIDSENNITDSRITIITKSNGKTFSEEEKNYWSFNGRGSYREDDYKGEGTYRIVTISEDGTKITEEVCYGKEPLSEYFADWKEDEDNYAHITLALSKDGNTLQITYSGKHEGKYLEESEDYKRQ